MIFISGQIERKTMPDYRKALLFSKLDKKQEYNTYCSQINGPFGDSEQAIESIDLYLKEIRRYPMLEKDNEKELVIRAQQGDLFSREKLIHANLRLVVRIARRYRRPGIPLPDLIAEGNFGLIHAIRKFDVSLEHRFSTYASWWIQHYVESFLLNQVRVVRLPVHVSKKIQRLEKTEKKLIQDMQRDIRSPKALAAHIGISVEEVSQLKIWSDPISSLESQDEDQQGHIDVSSEEVFFSDFGCEEDAKDTEQSHLHMIQDLIKTLSDQEKDIIFHRTGMGGFQEMTFEEIASYMELKKDRVRCIYQNAVKKMNKLLGTNTLKAHRSKNIIAEPKRAKACQSRTGA